ncbi:MAG: hypothetical protein E6K63_07260 [Nitrospirae bacterium]|nr:MAG: hypothetical protein E6K63_07260 [Nitrospirota bacterium]
MYVYRPSLILWLSSIDIKANGTIVNSMYSGTYYPYVTDPGLIEFSAKTETTDTISLYAQAGQTYFLKMGFKQGILMFRPHLMIVPESEAEQEITEFNYKLLREPGN